MTDWLQARTSASWTRGLGLGSRETKGPVVPVTGRLAAGPAWLGWQCHLLAVDYASPNPMGMEQVQMRAQEMIQRWK